MKRLQAALTGRNARLWAVLVAAWLLLLVLTPIGVWLWGREAFPLLASLGVLAQAGASLLALVMAWNWGHVARAALIVAVGAWAVEALGAASGFPFGPYHYTGALQPQVGGVPLLIPLAWFMMLAPSWAVADALLDHRRGRQRRPMLRAALAALAITAWDLYLDPQMVGFGLWAWDAPGGYFGVPWQNFLGWWLTAFALTLLVDFTAPGALGRGMPRPNVRPGGSRSRLHRQTGGLSPLPTSPLSKGEKANGAPLLVIYTLTWLFQAVGLGIFWGQPGPALVGFVAMGAFVLLAWWRAWGAAWRS